MSRSAHKTPTDASHKETTVEERISLLVSFVVVFFFLKLYVHHYNWSFESGTKGKKTIVQKLSHFFYTRGKNLETFHGVNVYIMHKPKAVVNFNYCRYADILMK